MRQKYDIVYSMGHDCACAMYMKSAHLRLCSGPFDWLAHSPFEKRIDLIINDFQDFLNRDYLEPLEKRPDRPNDENCDYYANTKTEVFFYHDFPIGVPLDESYPAVLEKYNRRIKRFYDNINKSKRVLIIYFSQFTTTPDDVVLDAANRVCKKFGKQIDFLIIEHAENVMPVVKRQIAKNVTRYSFHIQQYDENGKQALLGNQKLVKPIFLKYAARKPLSTIIEREFRRRLSDVICMFLPFRTLRGKIKYRIRGRFNDVY